MLPIFKHLLVSLFWNKALSLFIEASVSISCCKPLIVKVVILVQAFFIHNINMQSIWVKLQKAWNIGTDTFISTILLFKVYFLVQFISTIFNESNLWIYLRINFFNFHFFFIYIILWILLIIIIITLVLVLFTTLVYIN